VDIDAGWLFASLIVSSIGFVLFNYGRKWTRIPQIVAGLGLMIYPYFVHNLLALAAIALGISALAWLAVRLGW
jgi:Na+/phosphate symporter